MSCRPVLFLMGLRKHIFAQKSKDMASISVYRQTDKGPGPVRFRLSDGRGVCLYWSAGARSAEIMASDTGLERYKGIIARAYEALRREGKDLSSRALRRRIELIAEAQEAVQEKAQGGPRTSVVCAGGSGTTGTEGSGTTGDQETSGGNTGGEDGGGDNVSL